jgi:hypothetical protein
LVIRESFTWFVRGIVGFFRPVTNPPWSVLRRVWHPRQAGRRDLLRVLTSPSEVRADVIRQLYERPDGQEMADLMIFLEEWEWARQGMIEELSRA